MSDIEIFITDPAGQIVAQLDDYQSLTVTKKFNDVGTWALDLRRDIMPTQYFIPRSQIVILRDGLELISGPLTSINRTKTRTNDRIKITGSDYNILLNQRLAWPCNAEHDLADGTAFFELFQFRDANEDVVNNESAETIMKHYVDKNMTENAWDAVLSYFGYTTQQFRALDGYWPHTSDIFRAVPRLDIAEDRNRGANLRVAARFVKLLVLLKSIARSGGGLGFSIERTEDARLSFDVFQPPNRSQTTIFSEEMGNMSEFDYALAMPTSTYGFAGNSEEGDGRTFGEWTAYNFGPYTRAGKTYVDGEYPMSTWGRIETDLAGTQDKDDGPYPVAAAYDALGTGQAVTSVSFKLNETEGTKYGESLALGDIVTVEIPDDNFVIQSPLTTIQFDYANGQPETVTPTVGDPDAKNPKIPDFFTKQKQQSVQIARLQSQ